METVARVLVSSLVDHGTDRVFCAAGESYLGVLDEVGLHAWSRRGDLPA